MNTKRSRYTVTDRRSYRILPPNKEVNRLIRRTAQIAIAVTAVLVAAVMVAGAVQAPAASSAAASVDADTTCHSQAATTDCAAIHDSMDCHTGANEYCQGERECPGHGDEGCRGHDGEAQGNCHEDGECRCRGK